MQVTDEMLAAYKIAHRAAVDAALNDYSKIATIADDARRALSLLPKLLGVQRPCVWEFQSTVYWERMKKLLNTRGAAVLHAG